MRKLSMAVTGDDYEYTALGEPLKGEKRQTVALITFAALLVFLMSSITALVASRYLFAGLICASQAISSTQILRADPKLYTSILSDGTHKYERRGSSSVEPELLILAMTYDESSWAKDWKTGRNRTAEDFLILLKSQINLSDVSVGFLTASELVFHRMIAATHQQDIGHVTILYQSPKVSYSYKDRKQAAIQHDRRGHISIKRNILMSRTLREEKHIFWLDADIVEMSPGLIKSMVRQSDLKAERAGIITARCDKKIYNTTDLSINYDWNAWVYDRTVQGMQLAVPEDLRQPIRQKWIATRKSVYEITLNVAKDEMAKLDSVGGTVLYMQSDLVRKGILFPAFNVIGTTLAKDGWVGQETEGLCYVAKHTTGTDCWTLGRSFYAQHAY